MNFLSATIKTTVKANQVEVFEYIAPIDLTSIFKGYGLLPSVIGTQNQIGSWDTEGQTRTVNLSDNSSVKEMLTKYEHPYYFSYTVSCFTGSLRFLTNSANGEWWFSGGSSGQTNIKWRYTFNARSFLALPILWLITNLLWRNYMHKALQLSKSQIEHNVI
jgi:hypothetical protein